ncbi:MAG: histidine kinase [Holophagaceae bacterium]|nr:histidine kinase [Holophagaceae bacterium]
MHPVFSSRANLVAYLLVWLIAGTGLGMLGMAGGESPAGSLAFGTLAATFAATVFLPVYYPCLALQPEKTNVAILLPSLIALACLFGSIWAGAAYSAVQLIKWLGHESVYAPGFLDFLMLGSLACIVTEAIYYSYIARRRSAEAERLEQELRVMAREAELRALRAQLNPHFLFNSLNSISALTTVEPERARQMCVLLSDFLRKSLHLGEQLSVPLSEELDLMGNYLAIEQLRFSPRLSIEWEIDESSVCAEIPTLLLQPLIENAVKHGISQLIEGGTVKVRTEANGDSILVLIENPMDSDVTPRKGLGLGIRQVHQRLEAFFGGDGRMEISSGSGRYCVRLTFPMIKKESGDD